MQVVLPVTTLRLPSMWAAAILFLRMRARPSIPLLWLTPDHIPAAGYQETSSIFADQERPRNTSPNAGEGRGSCGASANEYSCVRSMPCSPNKLWRSSSIFNPCIPGIQFHQSVPEEVWPKISASSFFSSQISFSPLIGARVFKIFMQTFVKIFESKGLPLVLRALTIKRQIFVLFSWDDLGCCLHSCNDYLFYVLLPYIIVMESGRFSQSPAFLWRTTKERDKKYSIKSPKWYKK